MQNMAGGPRDGPRGSFPVEDERNDDGLGYKQVAAILSVSTVFLDTVLKNDPLARFWMDDKANPWLGSAGSLKYR